jgi:hypothetical protein
MLGRNVVYVVGRGDRHGGVYHQPSLGSAREYETACGILLHTATLMQRPWAEHTGAAACERCFGRPPTEQARRYGADWPPTG